MKSEIRIDTDRFEELEKILGPSLNDSGKVKTGIETTDQGVKISSKTETLGQLRGSTDSVFRLSSLAKKIIEQ